MALDLNVLATFTLARREHEGLKRYQLARKLGLKTFQIHMVEAGKKLTPEATAKILKYNDLDSEGRRKDG